MTYMPLLVRVRQLFKSARDEHLDCVVDALSTGVLHAPARPMSDQELARAIRDFRAAPVSDWSMQRMKKRLLDASHPHGGTPA